MRVIAPTGQPEVSRRILLNTMLTRLLKAREKV